MTRTKLLQAERLTLQLFEAVEKSNLIVAGKTESQLCLEVCDIASRQFRINEHWHKKIVRAGKNSICIYPDNPPEEIIQTNDTVILDFGPIVEGYEADLGRTYILGENARLLKMKQDVEKAWYQTQEWYHRQNSLKASTLFQYVVDKASEFGWSFGGEIAGHIVGKYPHEQPADPASLELDIHPSNHNDLFLTDARGEQRHWILELLFIDKQNERGAYFEQLL